MSDLPISDQDQQIFADLRRHHLRHPGVVRRRIVNLFDKENLSVSQRAAAKLEWLKLGLNNAKGTRP